MAILTVVRLVAAASIPLAPDEAYYWIWSRALAPGYLDHPPMVALWIAAGTSLLGETPLGIRLLGPLSAVLGTWMLADSANRIIQAPFAGIVAAALLNATLFLGVGAVVVTPDTPLLFFWTGALWAAARLATGGAGAWWLTAGLFTGLALLSKYTAVLLCGGLALWVLLTPTMRPWLRRPHPWIGALLGGALFLPVVWWNAGNGWASFLRQGGRVGDWDPGRALQYLAELVGSQAGLATPGVWVLCLVGMTLAVRRAWNRGGAGWGLLAVLSVLPALVFLQHALGDRVQGNWPAVLYPAATVAAAGAASRFWRVWRWPSVALGLSITALVYVQAGTQLVPLPPRLDPTALRLAGWDELAQRVEAARTQIGAGFVAADQYALASELAWTLPGTAPVLGVESRWRLFALPSPALDGAAGLPVHGTVGLLVRDVRHGDHFHPPVWLSMERVGEVTRTSRNGVLETYALYRVVPSPEAFPAAVLPRRGQRADIR